MVIGTRELERIADDMFKDRAITGDVFCGKCGYNLRTLPYVYHCPECGNEYNARPLKMTGIFNPYAASFPLRDVMVTLVCVLAVVVLGASMIMAPGLGSIVITTVFVMVTILNATATYRAIQAYARAAGIIRRIRMGEED